MIKNVTLPSPSEGGPTVGLHVMAKNAESVIGRLLDCVLPHVDGLSLVLNDTTDATLKVVSSKIGSKWLALYTVTSENHPELYFQDVPATYLEGTALAGETFDGPYTGGPLLADWAGARNVGWDEMTIRCAYKLFLDADDVVEDPQNIRPVVALMAQNRVDVLASRYTFGRGGGGHANSVSYRERLVRSTPDVRWEGETHEVLRGGLRRVLLEDALRCVDVKDNWGRGVRVPGRCFKVLYRRARLSGWQVPRRHLAYLVQESPGMMPASWVTDHLVPLYLSKSRDPEEAAWVLCMVGETWEARGDYARASSYYTHATEHWPAAKAYFRLCRSRFHEQEYEACARAYEEGALLVGKPVVLDEGPVYADSTKIIAAQAYHTLGGELRLNRARQLVREAALAFPASRTVAELRDLICGVVV